MQYATSICDDKYENINYMRYVGYQDIKCNKHSESAEQFLFSEENINEISQKITQLLIGVGKNNKPIKVPDKTIISVLSQVFTNHVPETGDIYTRYNIPSNSNTNSVFRIIDVTINIITSHVRNDLGIREYNSKLTKWTTVLGNFNQHNLQSHSKIKLRERRPNPMLFNMNY
jgi:hypothetical protein